MVFHPLDHRSLISSEMARNKALLMLGQIAMGGDPIAEKKASTIIKVTLNEVFKDYLKTRKTLKPKTISNYKFWIKGSPAGNINLFFLSLKIALPNITKS